MAAYKLFFKKSVQKDMEALGTAPILRPKNQARKLGQAPSQAKDLKKILSHIKALGFALLHYFFISFFVSEGINLMLFFQKFFAT